MTATPAPALLVGEGPEAYALVYQWSATQVLDLYRLRWQVEVLFRRWKGLLTLADLRAHDPQLVQTCLLGKLVLVVLCDALKGKGGGQGHMPPNIIEIRWHDLGHTARIGFQWDILRTRDFRKDPV